MVNIRKISYLSLANCAGKSGLNIQKWPRQNFPKRIANGSSLDVSHLGSITTPDFTIPNAYLVYNLSFNFLFVG